MTTWQQAAAKLRAMERGEEPPVFAEVPEAPVRRKVRADPVAVLADRAVTVADVAAFAAARYPAEERAMPGDPQLSTCLHEAGHAVVYAAVGRPASRVFLDAHGGGTEAEAAAAPPLRQGVAMIVAGMVADGTVPSYDQLPERRLVSLREPDAPDAAKLATAKTLGMTEAEYTDGVTLARQILAERHRAVLRTAAALYHERTLSAERVAELFAERRAVTPSQALTSLKTEERAAEVDGDESVSPFGPSHQRATNSDRDRAASWITMAGHLGALGDDDRDTRLDAARGAKLKGALGELVADLPSEEELNAELSKLASANHVNGGTS